MCTRAAAEHHGMAADMDQRTLGSPRTFELFHQQQ